MKLISGWYCNRLRTQIPFQQEVKAMERGSRRGWQLGLVFVFLVAAFHIYSIQNRYMRDDEEIAFRTTSRDLSYTGWYQAMQDVHAPVWFSSFWIWQQFVGGTNTWGVCSVFLLHC